MTLNYIMYLYMIYLRLPWQPLGDISFTSYEPRASKLDLVDIDNINQVKGHIND